MTKEELTNKIAHIERVAELQKKAAYQEYVKENADSFTSPELEEAAEMITGLFSYRNGYSTPKDAFIAGAEWKKAQIEKKAVEGKLDCDDAGSWVELKKDAVSPSEAGDKVKLIILK